MGDEVALLHYTVIVPLLTAAAVAWSACRVLPAQFAGRYALGIALAAGFFVGYWLLPDWAALVPTKHWQWLPYLSSAAVLGGLTLAGGVSWPERLIAYGALAVVAAWQLVPLWEELQPPRHYSVPLLAVYLAMIAAGLAVLPDRLLGPLFVGLLAASAGTVALLIAIGVSLTYGQVAAIAAAALAGCFLMSLWSKLTRRASEGSAAQLPTTIRGLIPVFIVLVGGLAFVGTIEPSPPLPAILLAPAAPLMLWLFAAGPLSRLKGLSAVAAQVTTVIVPLLIALAIVIVGGEQGESRYESSRQELAGALASAYTDAYHGRP